MEKMVVGLGFRKSVLRKISNPDAKTASGSRNLAMQDGSITP